jgi:hypothetical membrane protein
MFNVFSDLGWHSATANIFNGALIIKGLVDCIFVWHIIRELKIQDWRVKAFLYLPVVSFIFIGIVPKFPLRPLHWFFVGLTFVSWLVSQYLYAKYSNSKAFVEQTKFIIIVEVIFVVFTFPQLLFLGAGEICFMALATMWLLEFNKILFKR